MSNLLEAFVTLFKFLFNQLTAAGTFFIESVVGQLILGVLLFSLIFYLFIYMISKVWR